MYFGESQQIHILPDAVDMIPPHGTCRDDTSSDRRIIFKQGLAAYTYQYLDSFTGSDFISDIETERQE